MIICRNVTKIYDKQTVLKGISFEVSKGELVFVTGPSGAGKSTLLKILYLAEWHDEGEIIVGDFNFSSIQLAEIPLLRRSMGIVFQDFKLIPTMTIYDNVAMALRIRGMAERDIKPLTLEALKKVYLRLRADSYPKALSGGEQQRVAIARAIVAEPQYLLADEPTGNLDPNTALDIIKLFYELNTQGTTILIATHNRELFKNSGKRVINIDTGRITTDAEG